MSESSTSSSSSPSSGTSTASEGNKKLGDPRQPPFKRAKTSPESYPQQQSLLQDPRIWKLLATSGYLDCKSLGRLLLLMCKNWYDKDSRTESTFVWKLFCYYHWGQETANSLLRVTGIPPKNYFLTFSHPLVNPRLPLPPMPQLFPRLRPLPPLSQPKFAPKDYLLIVDVRDKGGKLHFSTAVDGETIPEFFEMGKTSNITLEKPFMDMYEFEGSYDSFKDFVSSRFADGEDLKKITWKGTAHLIRKPDGKVLELVDMEGEDWIEQSQNYDQKDEDGYELYYKLQADYASTYFEAEGAPLASGRQVIDGPSLIQYLGPWEAQPDDDGFLRDAGMEPTFEFDYQVKLSGSNVTLGIHSFRLIVWSWAFGSGVELSADLERQGLQYAQLLEALPEWETAPALPSSSPPPPLPQQAPPPQLQHLQQQGGQHQHHLLDTQIPMLNLPNEVLFSQSLPTAEELALDDIFDNVDAGTMAAANEQGS